MKNNVVIIGAGRFGSYLGRQLRKHGISNDYILADGSASRSTDYTLRTPDYILGKAETVIFCVPIQNFKDALRKYVPSLSQECVVYDTCSVKFHPCEWMKRAFEGRKNEVIGLHPLYGPQSAPNTMAGQRMAVCGVHGEDLQKQAQLDWEPFNIALIHVTPKEHDKQMATQVLNHFVGRASAACGITRVPLSTKTHENFMDIQDLVMGNSEELFFDMNKYNPFAPEIRRKVIASAKKLDAKLKKLKLKK